MYANHLCYCKICEESMSSFEIHDHMEKHNKLVCRFLGKKKNGLSNCYDSFDTTEDFYCHIINDHALDRCCTDVLYPQAFDWRRQYIKDEKDDRDDFIKKEYSNAMNKYLFYEHIDRYHIQKKGVEYELNGKKIRVMTSNRYIISCCENDPPIPVKFIEPKKSSDFQKLLDVLIQTNNTIIKQNNTLKFNATKCKKIEKSNTDIKIEDQEECYLCMELLKDGETNILEPCKHKFCSLCTSDILKYEGNCPVCKKKYESIQ